MDFVVDKSDVDLVKVYHAVSPNCVTWYAAGNFSVFEVFARSCFELICVCEMQEIENCAEYIFWRYWRDHERIG
jgi:hypothetical protein